ncbi:uncharacterized protein BJ212DRAFT_1547700 [Suillus subaureus]|uniref:Uncharacterized protein n=1 Tax=Suillus subaureus TaxID=48587 RepID=A0A9P7JGM7_9AGAM|nr:uncharacterized protein BJ212DRAFT_1547700 [Suillus subaureus]KAG1821946.1 hypothetical protein BJ212DRAFT_1547700 [Suillus subaureus]
MLVLIFLQLSPPIKISVLCELLEEHPNCPFVKSILEGLHEGFWPCMDTTMDAFIQEQVDEEVWLGCFSLPFGPNLLAEMYSTPVRVVPKPNSTKLCLVVDHSAGDFSLNSIINLDDSSGVKLDGMHSLGLSLLQFCQECHIPQSRPTFHHIPTPSKPISGPHLISNSFPVLPPLSALHLSRISSTASLIHTTLSCPPYAHSIQQDIWTSPHLGFWTISTSSSGSPDLWTSDYQLWTYSHLLSDILCLSPFRHLWLSGFWLPFVPSCLLILVQVFISEFHLLMFCLTY